MEILIATKGNSEEARGHAILEAKGDILGFLCTDNLIRDKSFLRTMVWYASQPDIVGSYTAQYDYIPYDKPLNRYFALLGANDPLCWFLGKSDRLSYLHNGIKTSRVTIGRRMPSLGDNGFFVKRRVMLKAIFKPEDHFVIDVVKDMWKLGYKDYYRVSTQKLWHLTGDSWLTYFKNRYTYTDRLYFRSLERRRWNMVETKRDWILAIGFAITSLVMLPQLYLALRGWHKVKDPAWFLHVPVCLVLTLMYIYLYLKYLCQKLVSLFLRLTGNHRSGTV